MLSEPVLVDTGALIALYELNDSHHKACREQAADLPIGKAYTCWPVITEALYLLRSYPNARRQLLEAVENGVFNLLSLHASDIAQIRNIMSRYHDQEVDLADACLVHLADRESIETVFTLDRRRFRVFRRRDGSTFRILPDDAA